MKTMITALMLVGLVSTAKADIPPHHNPHAGTESKSETYSGPRAERKWNNIKTPVLRGSVSGWTGDAEAWKVERSEDGLEQTVCSQVTNFRNKKKPAKYSCTEEVSLDGKPLPKFVPPHHMG
jgi:hypothetical protein